MMNNYNKAKIIKHTWKKNVKKEMIPSTKNSTEYKLLFSLKMVLSVSEKIYKIIFKTTFFLIN